MLIIAPQTSAMLDCGTANNRFLGAESGMNQIVQSSVRPTIVRSRPSLSDRQDINSHSSSWSQQPVEHLLVATDLTQRSDRAIERSIQLADLLEAQLTLLHVVDEGLPRRLIKNRHREAQALLQEHIRILLLPNPSRDVSINVRTGNICAEIAREAIELGSDAIILGTHGLHPIGHGRCGHTAANVLHYSDRPLLVVAQQPTGPYRRAVILVESLSDPSTVVRIANRLAPRAETHIVQTNCATVPSMGVNLASSSQSLRSKAPDSPARALERRSRREPTTVDHQNNLGVLHVAVDAYLADLLVVEVCMDRGLPPEDAVRNVLGVPPCDLLFVRGRDNSKCT